MRVRDSGMPDEAYWETLFQIPRILDVLRLDASLGDVVEVGCGYGTFTLPVARRITGTLHAFDIEKGMVERTRLRALQSGVQNLHVHQRDILADGFGLDRDAFDAVLLFNILHAENPQGMMRAAADLLRPDGRLLVIHWRSDVLTPRGPELSIRPRPDQILAWADATGRLWAPEPAVPLPPWHFGVSLQRRSG